MATTINDLINLTLGPSQGSTRAATQAFLQNSLPVLQNQAQLRGLHDSPAFIDTVGRSLATALPQFISADQQDRRTGQGLASDLLLGGQGLGLQQQGLQQSAAGLSASIADRERARQLEAARDASNSLTSFASNVLLPAGAQQTNTAFTGLEGLNTLGQQQRDIQQAQFNAAEAERQRVQGLAQQGAFGPFGDQGIGSALIGQTTSGKQ